MTEFFAYDQLTWPEVAGLPRDTPLILPLGGGYAFDLLANLLDNPPRAFLLPSIPFGWPRSGLAVPASLLIATIANLLAGLREDGFSSVYVLIPTGLDWASRRDGSELPCLPLPQGDAQHANLLPGLDIPGAGQDKVVIISIGHTEQHGYHLPLSTDTIIVDAIAQGIVDAAPGKTTRLPAMPYGVSTHRPSFAGTFNAGGRVFEDFWLGVIDGLARRGFDRFYLISGHGGNCSFLVNVVKYAGERHRRIFCSTAWLYLSGTEGVAALEAHRRSRIGGMGHAGELETSLMLHLRPDLVHMEKVVDETDFIATPSYYMDWVEGGSLIANPPWDDDTQTGAYGAGSLATPENGALWLEAAIAEKVTHVAEIDEQQERREERRNAGYGLWGHYDEKRNRKT